MSGHIEEAKDLMNSFGAAKIPFLFILDFELRQPIAIPLEKINPAEILFEIDGSTNFNGQTDVDSFDFSFEPVSKERYAKAFQLVQDHIRHGDSFLLNLTMPSRVNTNLSLYDIFCISKARYKIWLKDRFVVFSPETFIKTEGRQISSFPMKGTIDASLPGAKNKLLSNKKELAEHYTIVDLIRNDLSMVAKEVKVNRFQQIERIQTHKHELLQMSSEITGILPKDFVSSIGDMIFNMLPAGSISGAPKQKTVEVIKQAEQYNRGYYTGVCGIFDGANIKSGVMIRFIESTPDGLYYKSGGGINAQSVMDEEYRELIEKIYIPV
jgi:para-aminobenzoate synthetase component 1